MKVLKTIFNFCCQYIKEILTLLWAFATWMDVDNVFLSLVFAILSSCIFYLLLYGLQCLFNLLCKPKNCKILHLSGKTIYMKHKKYADKKDFFRDFEIILAYAMEKGLDELEIDTHEVILGKLIRIYEYKRYRELYKECQVLDVKKSTHFSTEIGEVYVTRKYDAMNMCAKYEYMYSSSKNSKNHNIFQAIKSKAEAFVKSLKFRKHYKIVIKLKND